MKFFPQTALAYSEVVLKQETGHSKQDPMAAAFIQWEGNPYQHVPGEGEDPYFDLCFRNMNPLDDEFQQTARAVFEPLLAELKEAES